MIYEITTKDIKSTRTTRQEIPCLSNNSNILNYRIVDVFIVEFENNEPYKKISDICINHNKRLDLIVEYYQTLTIYENVNIVYYNDITKVIWIEYIFYRNISKQEIRKMKIKNFLEENFNS